GRREGRDQPGHPGGAAGRPAPRRTERGRGRAGPGRPGAGGETARRHPVAVQRRGLLRRAPPGVPPAGGRARPDPPRAGARHPQPARRRPDPPGGVDARGPRGKGPPGRAGDVGGAGHVAGGGVKGAPMGSAERPRSPADPGPRCRPAGRLDGPDAPPDATDARPDGPDARPDGPAGPPGGPADRPDGTVPEEDRLARVALMRLADAGDPVMGRLIAHSGPRGALEQASRGRLDGDFVRREREVAAPGRPADLDRLAAAWAARYAALKPDPAADLARAAERGTRLVIPGDPEWPTQLDDLGDSRPLGLWVEGTADLRLTCLRSVSIVGARAATPYGTQTAAELAADLGSLGWSVV